MPQYFVTINIFDRTVWETLTASETQNKPAVPSSLLTLSQRISVCDAAITKICFSDLDIKIEK